MIVNDQKVAQGHTFAQTTLQTITAITSLVTALATSYIGWELFKFVSALQQIATEWKKLGK